MVVVHLLNLYTIIIYHCVSATVITGWVLCNEGVRNKIRLYFVKRCIVFIS